MVFAEELDALLHSEVTPAGGHGLRTQQLVCGGRVPACLPVRGQGGRRLGRVESVECLQSELWYGSPQAEEGV